MTKTIRIIDHRIPAKKNTLRRSKGGGMHYDKKTRGEIDALAWLIKGQWTGKPVASPDIRFRLLTPTPYRDSDNAWTAVLDAMVIAGVLEDDSIMVNNGTHTILPALLGPSEGCEITLEW